MDITDDLERVDGAVTSILKDRALWGEFLRDPNGVFVRLGLHPSTTPEINDRANRIFYATLTNKQLIQLLLKHYKKFRPPRMKKFTDHSLAGLKKGVIQHDIELDFESIEHLLKDTETLRQLLKLTLRDLNRKRVLEKYHQPREIDTYIEKVVAALKARQSIEAHPKLEGWDRNYGIGQAFGGVVVEVSAIATSTALVEAAVVVTALVVVVAIVLVIGVEQDRSTLALLQAASGGDKESIRAVAILGRLLDLSGELLIHANNFEKGSIS